MDRRRRTRVFITGGDVSESERDITVGGVGDAPATVFEGFSYAALGHLHRPQTVRLGGATTVLAYSGSPLAFSFSERDHGKSVAVVDINARGARPRRTLADASPSTLRQVEGRLADLLAKADSDLAELADSWVKVILTDPGKARIADGTPAWMWPHTIALDPNPDVDLLSTEVDLANLKSVTDPVEITARFVEYVTGSAAGEATEVLLREIVEQLARADRGQ